MDLTELYLQRAKRFRERVNLLDKAIRQYSLARLIVALIILMLVYLAFKNAVFFYPIPLLMVLFFFFFFVQRQSKQEEEKKIFLNLAVLNQLEATAASDHDFRSFPSGEQFTDPHHPFSHDLDIFGSGSLFQHLNRCATRLGETELANDLTDLKLDPERIRQRQEAVRELGPLIEFRQQCWATGKQIHDSDLDLHPLW